MQRVEDLLKEADRLIGTLQINQAKKILKELDISDVSKTQRAEVAALCRRAGLNKLALKHLHFGIHEAKDASSAELLEYASTYRKLGLIQEAKRQLKRLNHEEVNLHLGYCEVHQWNYKSAQVQFEQFLSQNKDHGKCTVAQVNLASCLLAQRDFEKAIKKIDYLLVHEKNLSKHLRLNLLEMKAFGLLETGEAVQAEKILQDFFSHEQDENSVSKLFAEKWSHVLTLHKNPGQVDISKIKAFRASIRKQGHWETLRDFDFHISLKLKDQKLFNSLYFGTPFQSFRNRMMISEMAQQLPKYFERRDQRFLADEPQVLDSYFGLTALCSFANLEHRILMLFFSDAYQPWSVYRLFDSLFPDEIFDPFTSTKKIYQVIERLKVKIPKEQIEFRSTENGYRLRALNNGQIVVYPEMQFSSDLNFVAHTIRIKFGPAQFTIQDLLGFLPFSKSAMIRHLNDLAALGSLQKISQGRSQKYQLWN